MRPGILLDRDGTLIDFHRDSELGVVVTAFHPTQLRLLPGVIQGLTLLRDEGFAFAIATNQPGPAKGQVPLAALVRTNDALVAMLAIEGIRVEAVAMCTHHPEGGPGGDRSLVRECDCRKPAPGLLTRLIKDLNLAVDRTWMVGDTESDVRAAKRAGVRAGLLMDGARCELCPLRDAPLPAGTLADRIAPRLDLLAQAILSAR